ncbi:MAG: hypothetical protein HC913_19620 [Microscillaceae bacterium]|nr:hypothetical protein [Microscillaceae bacterium]
MRPSEGQSKASQTATRQFRFRYGLVLVLTALLFALSYLLLLRSLDKQADFVTQINTIGYQNALSQEITKWALALRSCEEENNCRTQMGKLQEALQKFKDTQGQLIRQHTLLKSEGLHNPNLDSILQVNYRVSYQHILQASQALMRLTEVEIQVRQKRLRPQASLRHNLSLNTNKLLFREQTLTHNAALVARLYDQEAKAYIQRIKTYQTLVLVVAFIILVLEALIFSPKSRVGFAAPWPNSKRPTKKPSPATAKSPKPTISFIWSRKKKGRMPKPCAKATRICLRPRKN